jgi:autotransporter-associated beta strand protein
LNPASGLAIGLTGASIFDLKGFTQTLAGLTGTTNDVVRNGGASPTTLTLNMTVTNAFSGSIQDGVSPVSIVKQGSGTLLLNGANTFTRATLVSGGVLGGTGIISGPVSVQSGAMLVPGGSIGNLTVNNDVNLNANSTTLMVVNAAIATADKLNVAGTLTYGGALNVVNVGGSVTNGESFQLFNAAAYIGNFSATNLPGLPGGFAWVWNPAAGMLSVVQTVAVNPTNLTTAVSGSTLNISWPTDHTGWRLEAQTNNVGVGITTNWFTWPGSSATNFITAPISSANGAVFFRLVYP